jgi:hypothetical protein
MQFRIADRRFWQGFKGKIIMKNLMKSFNCNLVILIGHFFASLGKGYADEMLYLIEQIGQEIERFPVESFDLSYPLPYVEWEYALKDVIETYEITSGEDTIIATFNGVKPALLNILIHGGTEDRAYELTGILMELYDFMETNELFREPGEEYYSGHILEY